MSIPSKVEFSLGAVCLKIVENWKFYYIGFNASFKKVLLFAKDSYFQELFVAFAT